MAVSYVTVLRLFAEVTAMSRLGLSSSAGITLSVIALHHQKPQLILNICMFAVVEVETCGNHI